MKFQMILASAAIACMGFGIPAFAQAPAPQTETMLQDYIRTHPEVQRDPALFNNPAYLSQHPGLARFLQNHPYAELQTERMGAYDQNHQWRNADWWHNNDPNWVEAHHPEWNKSHPAWANDGAYDDAHQWHKSEWWAHNRPDWVKEHHPQWAEAHPVGAPVHEVGAPPPVANEPHPHPQHHSHPNVPYNGHNNG